MTQLLLLSLGKIVLAFFFYIFAMRLFSVDLTVWEECFAFGIFTFATVIPVQGIMGLGTFEAYFSIGLILLGISSGTALVLGFLVHMLFLASFLLVALYFLWFVLLRARTTIE